MRRYLTIVLALARDRLRNETAYLANIFSEAASTVFYIITYVLFINLLFGKIGSVAGYSKNDIYFMMLVGQFTYYLYASFLLSFASKIITTVRTGEFDLIVLKPINSLFYIYGSSIKPITTALVSLPNILFLIILINWGELNLSFWSCMFGFICWFAAILILNTIILALSYPVFTKGDAVDSLGMSWSLFAMNQIPYNKLPVALKALSFNLVPTLLSTGGVAYIALQKGSYTVIVILSVLSGLLSVILFKLIWRKAMREYSSASS